MTQDEIEFQDSRPTHYNQRRRRKAEFIRPPNTLKAKVGSGGVSETILAKAQAVLENNTVDFRPLAEMYLENLLKGVDKARTLTQKDDRENVISHILYPAMQLKANGGMFHYNLVTKIADKLVQFLEVIEELDLAAIEIILAYHATLRAIILGGIKGDGGTHGQELLEALDDACTRYFDKKPRRQRHDYDFDQ